MDIDFYCFNRVTCLKAAQVTKSLEQTLNYLNNCDIFNKGHFKVRFEEPKRREKRLAFNNLLINIQYKYKKEEEEETTIY
jgi:hypothetical protein